MILKNNNTALQYYKHKKNSDGLFSFLTSHKTGYKQMG